MSRRVGRNLYETVCNYNIIYYIVYMYIYNVSLQTHAHVHHSVAMRGGRSNHSASGADKVIRVGPAWSYCHPMMYFIIYVQVEAFRYR